MAFEEQPGITSEVVQKYLEENQQLLLSILENQNLGKLEECSLYQARVQQNLLFLARLAEPYTSHQPDGSQQNNKYNLRQGPRQNVFASLEPADSLSQESQASLPHTEAHPPQPLSAYVMRNGHSTVTAVTQPPAVFHYLGTLADQTSKNENSGYWQPDEHERFLQALEKFGRKDIKSIANFVQTRNTTQVRSHLQKFLKRKQKSTTPPSATSLLTN